MGLFSKSKTYRWNEPNFKYARGYTPGALEATFDPRLDDWMGYGQYQGAQVNPLGLQLSFLDRDIIDTDYRIFDPGTQKWGGALEDMPTNEEFLRNKNWMQDVYEYGDPYSRNLYYTPYELALGHETGVSRFGAPMKWDDVKMKDNAASIHPTVGYDYWNDALLADLAMMPEASGFIQGTNDKIQHWNSPGMNTPYRGYITEDNPWDYGTSFDFDKKKKTVKSSGIASILGPVLSIFGGPLAPLGYALSAGSAIANKDPLQAVMAGIGAWGSLGNLAGSTSQAGMLAAQEAGLNTLGWAGATTGTQGLLNTLGMADFGKTLAGMNPYVTNAAMGGVKAAAKGGDPLVGAAGGLIGTAGQEYVAPQIKAGLSSMGLNEGWADTAASLATNYGTGMATSYLSSLGDDDSYSESLSRATSKANPQSDGGSSSFEEGIASGYGLPAWMAQQYQMPKDTTDSAKGKMTYNQLGGFDPEKSTKFLVG